VLAAATEPLTKSSLPLSLNGLPRGCRISFKSETFFHWNGGDGGGVVRARSIDQKNQKKKPTTNRRGKLRVQMQWMGSGRSNAVQWMGWVLNLFSIQGAI
jgi:hypothetical protein